VSIRSLTSACSCPQRAYTTASGKAGYDGAAQRYGQNARPFSISITVFEKEKKVLQMSEEHFMVVVGKLGALLMSMFRENGVHLAEISKSDFVTLFWRDRAFRHSSDTAPFVSPSIKVTV
jgi:hypothetical protein